MPIANQSSPSELLLSSHSRGRPSACVLRRAPPSDTADARRGGLPPPRDAPRESRGAPYGAASCGAANAPAGGPKPPVCNPPALCGVLCRLLPGDDGGCPSTSAFSVVVDGRIDGMACTKCGSEIMKAGDKA